LDALTETLQSLLDAGGPYNLQLSGGEPTLRDDLPDIVGRAKAMGFEFVQVNTNGIRLARDEAYARRLRDAGVSCVYLQFDGVRDDVYRRIRGAALLATKTSAIERCEELGLGVVLVPTVVPGVNDAELGDIVRFALARGPAVRGVHFQPVSYFGRFPGADRRDRRPPAGEADAERLTLPEVMNALERQTDGMVKLADFRPGAAENAHCSFSATFTRARAADGSLRPLRSASAGCCAPRPGGDARAAQRAVARRWAHPSACCEEPAASSSTLSLDAFLAKAHMETFAISGMAFQDAYTLDLARLRDCYIHVADAPRSIVPFCAYNLTSDLGRSLYRRE
jgi:7,8-dihydro-6-hydroxymethylpterin dimethyltransferase